MAISVSVKGDKLSPIENTTIHAALHSRVAEHEIQGFVQKVLAHSAVAPLLQNIQHRVLSVEPVDVLDKAAGPKAHREWITTIYDYTNNQTLQVRAGFPAAANAAVTT